MKIDPFANHAKALQLRAQRNEVLASNLANADTPNYKARDIDFASTLANERGGQLAMARTSDKHIAGAGETTLGQSQNIAYRIPTQPAVDGNTVETDIEQAAYAENVVGYQASLSFVNQKIRGLQVAIKGQV
ncbi:MAG: flagellar basal body rod protein FlgB [Woeseiaceae bacterium]